MTDTVSGVEIVLDRVTKSYPGQADPAVDAVSLTIPAGQIVVLVGPPAAEAVTDEAIAAKLTPMLSEMSLSAAARAAADELGVAKARAYDIGIALKRLGG